MTQQTDSLRDQWLAAHGEGRRLPDVPARRGWAVHMHIQAFQGDGGAWLVANYGDSLLALRPREGWFGPLDTRAESFVVVPDSAGGGPTAPPAVP